MYNFHPASKRLPFPPQPEASAHAPGLTEQLSRLVSSEKGSWKAPKGLRHQSCTVVGPFAVIFGGETLAHSRDSVCNDLYIYDTSKWGLVVLPKAHTGLKPCNLWQGVPQTEGETPSCLFIQIRT